jgi:hypothetical protein
VGKRLTLHYFGARRLLRALWRLCTVDEREVGAAFDVFRPFVVV